MQLQILRRDVTSRADLRATDSRLLSPLSTCASPNIALSSTEMCSAGASTTRKCAIPSVAFECRDLFVPSSTPSKWQIRSVR